MQEITEEIWKDVVGHEGFYKVSNKGRIISYHPVPHNKKSRDTPAPRLLKPRLTPPTYLSVQFHAGGKSKNALVHRVVAEAFIPNPKALRCVNHKNSIRTDNRADNLEWVTHKENTAHGILKGFIDLQKTSAHWKGQKSDKAKEVINLSTGVLYESALEAAKAHNIKYSTLKARLSNRVKKSNFIYI